MISDSLTFISWLLVVVFFGAVAFMLDSRVGTPLYRWWYGMTHREGLPVEIRRGFIVGQRAQERFIAAFVLATAHALFATFVHSAEPLAEILTWLAEIPVLMLGFYAGPKFEAVWQRKDDVLEAVNKVEAGELSLSAELSEISRETAEKVRGAIREVTEHAVIGRTSGESEAIAPGASHERVGGREETTQPQSREQKAPEVTTKEYSVEDASLPDEKRKSASQPTEAEGRAMMKRFIRD